MPREATGRELIEESERRLAQLRSQVAEEEKFLALLRARMTRSAGAPGDQDETPRAAEVVAGSMATRIIEVMREAGRPMRGLEVAQAVHAKSKDGTFASIQNTVFGTLRRRDDLFLKIARGVYSLRDPK